MTVDTLAPRVRERRATRISLAWHHAALAGVLGLAALLNLYRLQQNGYANTYYAAAVRSMLASWHDFFFASFDPGGLVSVDKPPLALWVEAASAKLFGYSGFTILLPEALAGIAAVGLLYLLVARYFGRVPGLVAALALAVSPVSVAVNRDNNPDALFVLLLVAAVYIGARAAESGRLRTLVLSAFLVGLAFNTKMLAAGIVVPGIAVACLLLSRLTWPRRLANAAVALLVLVVTSGAWVTAVQLTPAVDRPYVGSTTDNSALSLVLGYNGLGRVLGQDGGTSRGGGGFGGAFSGTPGLFRLLNDALGDQGAWLLPLAILGGASAIVASIRLRRRREGIFLVVAGGWFATAAVVFSYSSGIIHTYYLSALAPATAALVGAGVVSLWHDARRGGWWVALPIAAVVLSGWLELDLLRRTGYQAWLQAVAVLGTIAAVTVLAALGPAGAFAARIRTRTAAVAVAVAVAALLAAPTVWSATVFQSAVNGVFPGAGPTYTSARGGFGGGPPGSFISSDVDAALAYVESHGAANRFGLIVSSEQEAAGAVIRGEPVAAMGGFTGRETVLTNDYLARLIRTGEARYFLLGGGGGFAGPGGSSNAAVSTITSTCTAVSGWSSTTTQSTLYDCADRADAIEAAG
jgi:4-amino-4-deoxy-L-arabinose transferase-like glycosyltransferase